MSLIIEGCDGAGKTTLIQRLQYDFPHLKLHARFSTSKEGPLDNLAGLVYDDLLEMATGRWIYDRHPIISEYIYGQFIPTRTVQPDMLSLPMAQVYRRVSNSSLVVWCHPPFTTLEKNFEVEDQMPGVAENLRKLYDAYTIQQVIWRGESVNYDYTDPISYHRVYETIRSYYYRRGMHV